MTILKTMSLAKARSKFTFVVREVQSGAQVLITKDGIPAARIISEDEYQQIERRLAVARLRTLADRFRERGLTWKDFHSESHSQLEKRP